MPYSLPLAMLQMDAEPGSLTTFSNQPWGQGPYGDANLALVSDSPQVCGYLGADAIAVKECVQPNKSSGNSAFARL